MRSRVTTVKPSTPGRLAATRTSAGLSDGRNRAPPGLAEDDDLVAGLRQRVAERALNGRVGIDDEDPDGHRLHLFVRMPPLTSAVADSRPH